MAKTVSMLITEVSYWNNQPLYFRYRLTRDGILWVVTRGQARCEVGQPLGCLVKYLAYSVNVIANGRAFLFVIVEQINWVEHIQIVNLALYRQQQTIVNAFANDGEVNIRSGTEVAFRPGAEYQNLLDVSMTAKNIRFRGKKWEILLFLAVFQATFWL